MFDRSKLVPWLRATREQIDGDRLDVPDKRGALIFRDHGADVLLVAHLDWVGEFDPKRTPRVRVADHGNVVRHPALDDRLGCWAIEQLHARGVHADLLFTDCEETGRSTGREFAELHAPPGRYRCVVMLDRAGTDSVLYQYEDAEDWERFCMRRIGPLGNGSYSCIAAMDALGACGVNIGIGYYDHNGPRCWTDLRLAEAQMARTATFIAAARRRAWLWSAPTWSTSWLDDPRDDVTAARLCVTCGRGGDLHLCPFVADCDCCALELSFARGVEVRADG